MIDTNGIPEDVKLKVLVNMNKDMITKTVMSDPVIAQFGSSLLKKLGPKRANDIAQRMTQLGRIAMRLQNLLMLKKPPRLREYICIHGFDQLVEAIFIECEAYDDSNMGVNYSRIKILL